MYKQLGPAGTHSPCPSAHDEGHGLVGARRLGAQLVDAFHREHVAPLVYAVEAFSPSKDASGAVVPQPYNEDARRVV